MQADQMTEDNFMTTNWRVQVQIGKAKAEGEINNRFFNQDIFNSGVPLRFKAAPAEGVAKHMVKLAEGSYYFPFNTITSFGSNQDDYKNMNLHDFTLMNKFGANSVTFTFLDVAQNWRYEDALSSLTSRWSLARNNRNSHITLAFEKVRKYAKKARIAIEDIDAANKSNAEKKAMHEKRISEQKKVVQTLTNEVTVANEKLIKASQELVTVENTLKTERQKRKKLVIEKENLKLNIKLLKEKISTEELLKKLEKEMNDAKAKAEYWLKGSVYHRVVSEAEKADLMKVILDDATFDKRVAGYFSPQ